MKNWQIHQIDINNAYLHGYLEEDIYLEPPLGYNKAYKGQVCKLVKSLYGLKQAGRQWNKELSNKLMSFGFHRSHNDHCLYVKNTQQHFLALVIYVDDILISGSNPIEIQAVKKYLHGLFTIKDMGEANYFLGVEVARNATGITISQTKYARDILLDIGLMDAKPARTPLPSNFDLDAKGTELEEPEKYRRIIG